MSGKTGENLKLNFDLIILEEPIQSCAKTGVQPVANHW